VKYLVSATLGLSLVSVWPAQTAPVNKLVVIVEENIPYSKIPGDTTYAPYLNSLISRGLLFTDYTAIKPGSGGNYLAMVSGLTTKTFPTQDNLFQAIDGTAGSGTWKAFNESESGTCTGETTGTVPGLNKPLYTNGHDPAYGLRSTESCRRNNVPMNTTTFDPAALPSFSYIVPNQCDDMHTLPTSGSACPAYFGPNAGNGPVKYDARINMGDNWLKVMVPELLAQPNVTVLITWDESSTRMNPPEHVATIEVGAGVSNSTNGSAFNHYSLEAGLYSYFGLGPAPNNGADATPLPIP
jgi:hypothetical protein